MLPLLLTTLFHFAARCRSALLFMQLPLLILAALALRVVSGGDAGSSSNALDGSSDESGSSDFDDNCDDYDEVPFWQLDGAADDAAGGDSRPQRQPKLGRPVEYSVEEHEFAEACACGLTELELITHFGNQINSVQQVRRLKIKWGLHGVAEAARCNMPSLETLQTLWHEDPSLTVQQMASHAGVSVRALRAHFKRVGFSPNNRGSDEAVLAALTEIQQGDWCSDLGATFSAAVLWTRFGIIAGRRQIRRCLAQLDPQLEAERKRGAARLSYVYTVSGPRSLYHCDAHEKLAKMWGFWFHLCIDGYSRFIIYLSLANNKFASTVGHIFITACNQVGWASRVRWDRGGENIKAIQAQWEYWWDETLSYEANRRRGSALTGRSVYNARAEYIWAFVKKHVSSKFRAKFRHMEKEVCTLGVPSLR